MAKLTQRDAAALRRILKAAGGRDLSIAESYTALHYLIRLLHILARVEKRRAPLHRTDQPGLF